MWWNNGARRQRAHHEHSAAPLAAFKKEFLRKSCSSSRSIGRGWENMMLPSREDPGNCVVPRHPRKSEWDQKLGKLNCVIHSIIRWYKMWSIYPGVSSIYTPHCIGDIQYPSISICLGLATGPDCDIGSGFGLKLNRCQINGVAHQWTGTANSGMIWWYTHNPSELDSLPAGHPVDPSIDSYTASVFAPC